MSSNVQPVLFRYPARVPGPVALVGSFNNWDPRTHLLRRVDRDWRIVVYLPPGTYPYAFVANGQLVRDPDPRRSFLGARYSMLTIGEHTPSGRGQRKCASPMMGRFRWKAIVPPGTQARECFE